VIVRGFGALLVCALCLPARVSGQLVASRTARIASGQQHLYVSNIDAHKAFWIAALGGVPSQVSSSIVKLENTLIVLTPRASGLGSKGSVVDHLGFQVQDIRAVVDKLKASGFPIATRAEMPPDVEVTDGVAYSAELRAQVAITMAPDNVKVEFVENPRLNVPVAMHHVHFATPDPERMLAWYVEIFGATRVPGAATATAELPGVRLMFTAAPAPTMPTQGRVHDHIGFEIKDLERFCSGLEARGIKLDRPFFRVPAQNAAGAFVTDPWGTHIELTEGLAAF
jgi:catechol 2,3-dioxygenase-like lactoylglutathione lyase family enzyme